MKNRRLKENINERKQNKSSVIENYEIEQMIVQSLDTCLKALEEVCKKTMHEGDEKTQALKNKMYTLRVKAHHSWNEINNNILEAKQSKKNLDFVEKIAQNWAKRQQNLRVK